MLYKFYRDPDGIIPSTSHRCWPKKSSPIPQSLLPSGNSGLSSAYLESPESVKILVHTYLLVLLQLCGGGVTLIFKLRLIKLEYILLKKQQFLFSLFHIY